MANVSNVFKLYDNVVGNKVGIEVEVEGKDLPNYLDKYWRIDADGSLRGESNEYVLAAPMHLMEAYKALDYLQNAYDELGSEIFDSVRCGVHVHVNVQDLSITELYNYFTLYSMFEGVLLANCGKGRVGNLFCLPLNRSPSLVDILVASVNIGMFGLFGSDENRYCSMNVVAIPKYGSLEFRALRGGPDLERIKSWASVLVGLKTAAKSYRNPVEIVTEAKRVGLRRFFLRNVQESSYLRVGNIKRKLEVSYEETLPIAYATDWSTL